MSILIGIFTVVLLFTSLFLIFVVLMQKAKADGGMGAALGGGATEAAFGADTSNVLTKATIRSAIVFFVLCFGLYLAQIYMVKHQKASGGTLPTIAAPAAVAPAPAADTAKAAPETTPAPAAPATAKP
ncbi:MAG TPA: preprotein translocase subunit SecG [Rariglobus sp.]|jgi:preprotein translocase subunit SecG|nr:preprotein translocase subunit SecG [Rariglobus sp.]